jgi:hypothetical protein
VIDQNSIQNELWCCLSLWIVRKQKVMNKEKATAQKIVVLTSSFKVKKMND